MIQNFYLNKKKNRMIQSKSSDQFILAKTIKKLVKMYKS